jgi:alkanesulfonate monooxygenase
MTAHIFWTLPPGGDGRGGNLATRGDFPATRPRGLAGAGFTDERGGKFNYYDYLFQVARAAEVAGFDGAVIPWDAEGEDPWIVASSVARHTRRLALVPELEPAFATPVYLAKMSVSFQRLSGNRLAWKLDLAREPRIRRAHGDFLEGADWYARADEFLQAARGVWTTRPFTFRGRFYDVEAGGFEGPLAGWPLPRIHTSGDSSAALEIAARHADVHLLQPARPVVVTRELARLDEAASRAGRDVQRGLTLRVVARHTDEEARRDALHELGAERSELALVGSYGRVAEHLDEYVGLGITHLVLDASPHLEEAYRLGEHVLPRLRSRFVEQTNAVAS